jgi:hypothetical protein
MLLGLRGTGKTVLLNRIETMAEASGFLSGFIEAQEKEDFLRSLVTRLANILRQLSLKAKAQQAIVGALRILKGFSVKWSVTKGDVGIAYDPDPGKGDSGVLEIDLTDLLVAVGHAAKSVERGVVLLVDEVQYLKRDELSAIIVAFHKVSQKQLPVVFFGAGLPSIAALAGNAKSYAERLFVYPAIGPLSEEAASHAIRQPIETEEERIEPAAIAEIVRQTRGYPYFLQEWGFHAWNVAAQSPITLADTKRASTEALSRLDEGFFRVRLDRLSPREKDYVRAMAGLGDGPYKSGDIARVMGAKSAALGPLRASIIQKGMIYSPAHGDIEFTVPMFADFLRRTLAI